MSGQQIGTVVGFVVGAYFGYPQLGAAIGGYIGGVIDPTQINGPHIGDGQSQSSADGIPIPWVLGTAPCVGNICMVGPRYEVKKTEGGKGDTTEVNTFESHQSFTILICESSVTRDSVITGIQVVRQNGKIVYDVRPGSPILAESAKWKENVTFYFGAEDQLPDPTMEAIYGVGNTPAFRGVCTAVFRDFNRTEFGDSIPQFEWVVISEGITADGDPLDATFLPGRLARFANEHFPLVDPLTDYQFTGFWVGGRGGGAASPVLDTIEDVLDWAATIDQYGIATGNPLGRPDVYLGYAARTDNAVGSYPDSLITFDETGTQPDATRLQSLLLLYQWSAPSSLTTLSPNGMCGVTTLGGPWKGSANGTLVHKVAAGAGDPVYLSLANCSDGYTEGIYPLCIQCYPRRIAPEAGTFRALANALLVGVDPTQHYDRFEMGPVLRNDDPSFYDAAFWTDAYNAAVAAGDLPAGWFYGSEYPVNTTSARLPTAVVTATNYAPLVFNDEGPRWSESAETNIDPRRPDTAYEYAFWPYGASEPATWYDSPETPLAQSAAVYGAVIDFTELKGWCLTYYGNGTDGGQPILPWGDPLTASADYRDRYILGLMYSRYSGGSASAHVMTTEAGCPDIQCSVYTEPQWGAYIGGCSGGVIFKNATVQGVGLGAPAGNDTTWSCYNGGTYNTYGVAVYGGYCIACRPKLQCASGVDPSWTPSPDGENLYIDSDGATHFLGACSTTTGTFRQLQAFDRTGVNFLAEPLGPIRDPSSAEYSDATFWTNAYDSAVAAGRMAAGLVYGVNYPAAVTTVCLCAGELPTLANGHLYLWDVVQRINRRGGLSDADIDVTELTDVVYGYPISAQYNAADCIRPLAGCYFFKGSEYDKKIHFHKDGADAVVVIDPEDFINGEDESDDDTRGQAKEYPRLLTGSYIDPTLDFAVGKTKSQRRSTDVRAIGETTLQIPVVMLPDEAAQASDKTLKIMWSRLNGTRKFSLPFASGDRNYLTMVPCIPFGLEGKRYVADQITTGDGQLLIEASYDRQSAYQSDVTAIPTLPPTPPVSTLSGPTMFAAMNLPALRSQDNTPGMYIAACGILSSWRGCVVQISYDDGATFSTVSAISVAAVMGTLSADITASSEPVSVSIYDGTLTNATDAQIATGGNAFAMVAEDDVSELAQFKTQDETTPDQYDLTDVLRGQLATTADAHIAGEQFVMVQNSVFLPIDVKYAGRVLVFRPVSVGTEPALNATYSARYLPIILGPEPVVFLETEAGEIFETESGEQLQAG